MLPRPTTKKTRSCASDGTALDAEAYVTAPGSFSKRERRDDRRAPWGPEIPLQSEFIAAIQTYNNRASACAGTK